MPLTSGMLKDFGTILRVSDYFGAIAYTWNEKTNRLKPKSPRQIQVYRARLWIAWLYKVGVLWQVYSTWHKASMFVVTHNIMFMSSYVLISSTSFVNAYESQAIANLFNSMIEYEERYYQGQKVEREKGRKFAKFLMWLMTMTGLLMPTFYHLDILRNPCFPMYPGYWLCNQCQQGIPGQALPPTWTISEIGIKIGMVLVSYWNWNVLMTGFPFYMSMEQVLQGHCLRSYISHYGATLKRIKISNGGPNCSTEKIRQKAVAIRELQVFTLVYREVFSRFVLVTFMVSVMIIEIVCLYNSIKVIGGGDKVSEASLQIGLNLIYFWCACTALFILTFIYGLLSDVYRVSKRLRRQVLGNTKLMRNKWFRRFFDSCPILRIYFGGSNFIEELTPLVMEDFVINQTVSLILLE